MAKKSKSRSSSERSDMLAFSRVLSFIVLVLSIGFLITLSIFRFTDNEHKLYNLGWLYLIKELALIAAILIPAYYFVKPRTKAWHVIYWVCVVIAIVFAVFGNINVFN